MSTDEKIARLRVSKMAEAGDWFDRVMKWCESPIERLFLANLLVEGWGSADMDGWSRCHQQMQAITGGKYGPYHFLHRELDTPEFCVVQPQFRLSDPDQVVRLDFAFLARQVQIAVELDGHAFHEKTKAQAKKEKSRQRRLTAHGWHVLRFTGSEVFEDPDACLTEINEVAASLVDKIEGFR